MTPLPIMSFAEIALAVQGRQDSAAATGSIAGVTTDSRAVSPGDLFVALAGEKYDGHKFVAAAAKAGAVCALVHQAVGDSDSSIATVQVTDTRLALGRLAGWWRSRQTCRLVALTGSNGKTTVKEMAAAILRAGSDDEATVLATEGNLNNDIGMPLTLLRLRARHRYAIVEMGMNHAGEIDYLTRIARPDIALVNNAQRAHVGELGGMQAVAAAKGEIFAGLGADGVAIYNADDAYAAYWDGVASKHRRLGFGLRQGDVRAVNVKVNDGGTSFRLLTPTGDVEAALRVPGLHNVANAAAACAIVVALDVPLTAIAQGLADYQGAKGRLQRKAGLNGARVVDDSYNANPDSMAAAIAVLARAGGTTVFVIGDMGELGADAASLHAEVGARAKAAGIAQLLALGEFTSRAVQAFGPGGEHYADISHLTAALRPLLDEDTTVLVKGSRFMRMERVVEAITLPMEP